MASSDEDRSIADLDKSFNLLTTTPEEQAAYEEHQDKEVEWKTTDPKGYKKDMEKMCREMFGDKWKMEYEAMLAEEFPEDV